MDFPCRSGGGGGIYPVSPRDIICCYGTVACKVVFDDVCECGGAWKTDGSLNASCIIRSYDLSTGIIRFIVVYALK